jgi:hypothetical protein
MSEEPKTPPEEPTQPAEDSWQEVGKQFENLGNSLAHAIRAAWKNIETDPETQQIKSGLESMAREVGKAVDEGVKTPEAAQVKAEARKAASSLRSAGEQTVEEIRPELASVLREMNEGLQKMIDKLEKKEP